MLGRGRSAVNREPRASCALQQEIVLLRCGMVLPRCDMERRARRTARPGAGMRSIRGPRSLAGALQHRYASQTVGSPTLIKKYGNRRLYDTGESRYITLEELSRKIQGGGDVRVIDAKTGEDLTQGTLTQIIIEGRGAARMLPVPLLVQLIRLGDDALAEFFGRHVSDALSVYLELKRGASAVARYNPFAAMPFAAGDALARMWMSSGLGAGRATQVPPAWSPPPSGQDEDAEDSGDAPFGMSSGPSPADADERGRGRSDDDERGRGRADELAQLRREIEELKRSVLQRDQRAERAERAEPRTGQTRSTRKRKPR
jgi:polyhydroxyalkanoate synthesis repressor PhaR